MRRAILQMLISYDRYDERSMRAAGNNRTADWNNTDYGFNKYLNDFLDTVDTLTLGYTTEKFLGDHSSLGENLPTVHESNVHESIDKSAAVTVPKRANARSKSKMHAPKNIALAETEISGPQKIEQRFEWNITLVIKEFMLEEILALKEQAFLDPDVDVTVFGNSDMTILFVENNAKDECRIMINPVVLGNGRILSQDIIYEDQEH